ncbi:AraC family transcriptional regulator [Halobacillus sp. Marseille-P3879]|uniref:helix-turn-helix transcriptional regulator n=1 Tax=Halobacillus sp. Marseille-P3879 TaxID=2045014 RepID=UPI000C7AF2FA|nr:AraC family transcriptional regulator [Halobacillus sp. Marseille-P3879]
MPTSMLEGQSRFNLNYCDDKKTANAFHSHLEYEIYYFHKGSCRYLIGDKIYLLSPGDVIIMDGLTLHRPRVFEREEYVRSTIHFESDYFKEILSAMNMEELLRPFSSLKSHCINLESQDRADFEAVLKRMDEHNIKKENPISGYRFQLAFIELLTLLYSFLKREIDEKSEGEKGSPGQMDYVQRVVSYIEHHYMEDLSMEKLEIELHLNRFYLSKMFKKVTGFTIFNYLYQRRINQAKIDFLVHPDRSVTEVSFLIGFKHPAHFSRVFKKLTGMTPEQYKKSLG